MYRKSQLNHTSGTVTNPATAESDSKPLFKKIFRPVIQSIFWDAEYDNKPSPVRMFSEVEAVCSSLMWKCAEESIKLTLSLSIICLYLMSCNGRYWLWYSCKLGLNLIPPQLVGLVFYLGPLQTTPVAQLWVANPTFILVPVVTQLQVELAWFAALRNIHPSQNRGEKKKWERKIKICLYSDQRAEAFCPMATQSLHWEEGRVCEATAAGNGWGLLIFSAACRHSVLGVTWNCTLGC